MVKHVEAPAQIPLRQDAGRGARRAHTTCVVEHWMLLFGGRSKTLESLGDLCVLDLGAMTWQVRG